MPRKHTDRLNMITDHRREGDIPGTRPSLNYDAALYLRYDASGPEDEAKKSLELIHVLDCIRRYSPFRRSLDIGAATGRYPTLFTNLGIEAFGVDIEPEAVAFARKKVGVARYPDFRVGDARLLPFDDENFDLITCMMGTAAHFPHGETEKVFAEIHRSLRPGGAFIMSTWDIECPHLTFLTIYSHDQKEEMRRNSPTRGQAVAMALRQGFSLEELRPLGLIRNANAREPVVEEDGLNHSYKLGNRDTAHQTPTVDLHGEMYMMLVRKR